MKEIYFTAPYRRSTRTIRLEYGQVKKVFVLRTYTGEINGRGESEGSPSEEVFKDEQEMLKKVYEDINEETEDRSFKKALKSFQNKVKECRWLRVQYKSKKGKDLDRWVEIPLGRKKRIG